MLKVMSILLQGKIKFKLESNPLSVYTYLVNEADSDVLSATFVHLVASFKKSNCCELILKNQNDKKNHVCDRHCMEILENFNTVKLNKK